MAKPKNLNYPRSKYVQAWVSPAELAVLDEMAAELGSYRSAVIRQAIAEMAMRRNIEKKTS